MSSRAELQLLEVMDSTIPDGQRGEIGSAAHDEGLEPEPAEAKVSEELLALATAAGDRFALLRGNSRLVFDYLEVGAIDRATRALDTYEAVAREFRQARHVWPGRLMRSMLASAQGRADEAAKLLDEAAVLAEGDTDPTASFVLAWCRVGHALEGEPAAVVAEAEEQLRRLREIPGMPAEVTGHDEDAPAIARPRELAAAAGLEGRVTFSVDDSTKLPRASFHLVTAEACAHGRPIRSGAERHP
jgi:hypothetical protein